MSYSSLFFPFLFLPFLLSPLPVMSAHASHQGSHQFETFRLATRNERPPGYEQTNGRGRVSDMQTKESRRAHAAKHRGRLHKVHALWSGPNPAQQDHRKHPPHHTIPDHTTLPTTPHHASQGFAPQRQGQRLPRKAAACSPALRRHHPTPAAAVLYCAEGTASQSPHPLQVHELCSGRGSWLWLQAHGFWSSIRSQPSGRRQPSLTTHVPVLDCAHLLCVRAYTRPPYLH